MSHLRAVDEPAGPQRAEPDPALDPMVALRRAEGDAASEVAASMRRAAMRLPGGSELRAELLDVASGYRALARSRGVVGRAPARRR